MKAARLVGPRNFAFEDAPVPTPQQGELLVRSEFFSVCGSDLRMYDTVFPEEQYPLRLGAPNHECVGIVEESLDPRFKKGQRVIALQAGGLVEYTTVAANRAVAIPDSNRDPATWVLCQPVGTVAYSVRRLGSVMGKRVVVIGQGPIGLTFTDLLARQGARQIIVADRHDYRLDIAKRLGATETINVGRDNLVESVRELTGGALADITVEACGRPEAAHQAFECLRLSGTAVIFGLAHDEPTFPFQWTLLEEKLPTIHVTNSARSGDMAESVEVVVDLVNQGRLNVDYLLTHRMSWLDVTKGYETYSNKTDQSLKVVMGV